jgi:hypothetical protein
MVTIQKTVDIPADRRLVLEIPLPPTVPSGRTKLTLNFESARSGDDGLDYEGECPVCAAKNYTPNAGTIAAILEPPGKRFHSVEEFWADLMNDDDEACGDA